MIIYVDVWQQQFCPNMGQLCILEGKLHLFMIMIIVFFLNNSSLLWTYRSDIIVVLWQFLSLSVNFCLRPNMKNIL